MPRLSIELRHCGLHLDLIKYIDTFIDTSFEMGTYYTLECAGARVCVQALQRWGGFVLFQSCTSQLYFILRDQGTWSVRYVRESRNSDAASFDLASRVTASIESCIEHGIPIENAFDLLE